jgi:hypothetical protein
MAADLRVGGPFLCPGQLRVGAQLHYNTDKIPFIIKDMTTHNTCYVKLKI